VRPLVFVRLLSCSERSLLGWFILRENQNAEWSDAGRSHGGKAVASLGSGNHIEASLVSKAAAVSIPVEFRHF
jgi:hypothetical protein